MWRNFSTIDGFNCNLCRFVAKSVIHTGVLSQNFMWRKIEPKSTFVEKKLQISGLGVATGHPVLYFQHPENTDI